MECTIIDDENELSRESHEHSSDTRSDSHNLRSHVDENSCDSVKVMLCGRYYTTSVLGPFSLFPWPCVSSTRPSHGLGNSLVNLLTCLCALWLQVIRGYSEHYDIYNTLTDQY